MIVNKVQGLDKLAVNLNIVGDSKGAAGAIANKLSGAVEAGLKAAGLYIQLESQKIVPVDEGILHNSAFTRAEPPKGGGLKTTVRVGYTAEYAVYVHEDMNANHKPGKTAKFIERVLLEKKKEINMVFQAAFRRKMEGA